MQKMNRRTFVAAAVGACAACMCGQDVAVAAAREPIDAGPLAGYGSEGIHDGMLKKGGFYIIRQKDRLFATTSVCTHKLQRVGIDPDNKRRFKCAQHGSVFSLEGKVEVGPARKSLSRFAIRIDDRKHVIVDPTKQFEEKDWGKDGAFAKV